MANEFTQKELLKFHSNSKGSKVSKGHNLENSPYQVLDLLREFDEQSGFNIRVLNWWGHGFFMFVYYGNLTAEKYQQSISRLKTTYMDCNHLSPWAYGQILSKHEAYSNSDSDSIIEKAGFLQFFKQIMPDPNFNKTYELIKKEIRFILENHY
ncbi:hypothetical protein M3O96_04220 [Aquiflexum sp. TKW24L]|uniref:hypothetical protein n=1 Tax=Aquiflexum sp. TKW24L TaxID=2942212 RepID=UPI0020BFD396|nr:hypothetical protein [Aquiflexum sp. TKW24L]MCL6258279.1 hypothetical protein [Aquiflexum sp. TKW24L]